MLAEGCVPLAQATEAEAAEHEAAARAADEQRELAEARQAGPAAVAACRQMQAVRCPYMLHIPVHVSSALSESWGWGCTALSESSLLIEYA